MAPQPLVEPKSSPRTKTPLGRGSAQIPHYGEVNDGGATESGALMRYNRKIDNKSHENMQSRSISDRNVGHSNQHENISPRGRRIAGNANAAGMANGMANGLGYGGGAYGMMPMGGMGYGYGMGYGGMGAMGPMGMIYSINYFIATVSQFASMLGMSTHAVSHLLFMARKNLLKLEKTIRQSEVRRWLQRKSEKSPLFRWALILVSMLAASQIVRLARYLIEVQLRRSGGALLTGVTGGSGATGSSQQLTRTGSDPPNGTL